MLLLDASTSAASVLACVLLLCQTTSARNLMNGNGTSRTSITLQKNPHWQPHTKTNVSNLAEVYNKFGIPMSTKLRKSWNKEKSDRRHRTTLAQRDGENVGKVTVSSGGYYVFPMSIGTPKQNFNVLFDTGSSDMWVFGSELPLLQNVSGDGHNFYDPKLSSTFVSSPGQSFSLCYGDGSCVKGDMGEDTVFVSSLKITENPVPLIYSETDWEFDQVGLDGVLGLGLAQWDSESPDPVEALPSFLLPQLSPLQGFTVKFTKDGEGNVDFSYIDKTKYIGDITYTSISNEGIYAGNHWVFNWGGFSIGSGDYNKSSIPVLTDTGNANMLFPPSIVAAWQKSVGGGYFNGAGVFVFRCASTVLPDFTFGLGDSRFTIHGALFKGVVYETGSDGFDYCVSTFYSSAREDVIVFGMPMFQSLFVVHDYGNHVMGFASRNDTGFEPVVEAVVSDEEEEAKKLRFRR